ncbi:MAG TPA: polyprenyl synthetase family protein [Thermoleophilaceae bacterium]|nr:polyprenyl synthetase family protein [Thermoleophilaceae bacterium]
MSVPAQLEAVLEAGGAGLADSLARAKARLAEVAAGHGPELAGHAGGTLAAGGKRLRPLLVFLCGGAGPAGRADSGDGPLLAAATAVELLHTASLVHDDVLDRAPLRRGHETVYARGGRGAATATGDFLFSRAFAELAATGSEQGLRALSVASSALARGELMQRAAAWAADVAVERYLERCELKTASLFAASCRLGALLGDRPDLADTLAGFGSRIGLAFQILDDVLDVSGPAQRTGKPRGADLLDGTVTLPLILARERDPDLRALDLRTTVTDPAQVEAVCDRIAATGALDDSRTQALAHVAAAKDSLVTVDLHAWQHRALDLVADGVVQRYS